MKVTDLFEGIKLDLPEIVADLKKSKTIETVEIDDAVHIDVGAKKGDSVRFTMQNGGLWAIVQGQKDDIYCGDIGKTAADVLSFLKGINKSWYREHDDYFED